MKDGALGAVAVMGPDLTATVPPSTGPGDAQRNARYVYLIARLKNRQMTMEEATELFTLMQGMLRQSEAARAAMMRLPPPPSATPSARARPAVPPSSINADDFLLLGVLAMGAGAGLLAALTKRMQELAPPANPAGKGSSGSGASSR
jgi:hypothetical protein